METKQEIGDGPETAWRRGGSKDQSDEQTRHCEQKTKVPGKALGQPHGKNRCTTEGDQCEEVQFIAVKFTLHVNVQRSQQQDPAGGAVKGQPGIARGKGQRNGRQIAAKPQVSQHPGDKQMRLSPLVPGLPESHSDERSQS